MAFWVFVSHLQGTNCAALTLTLKAATFSGRAIGPATATAANSMAVRVVSCMVRVVCFMMDEA
jgi:hypothetical protein